MKIFFLCIAQNQHLVICGVITSMEIFTERSVGNIIILISRRDITLKLLATSSHGGYNVRELNMRILQTGTNSFCECSATLRENSQ